MTVAQTSSGHRDFSATPLVRKLGIVTAKGACRSVAVLGEPAGLRELLADCPAEVHFTSHIDSSTRLAIVFVRTRDELQSSADLLAAQLPEGVHGWICWPKARLKPGFGDDAVRTAGLQRGLVDYKVCSVSADWSALKFARRKP